MTLSSVAQTEIQIKKTTSMKIPGMPSMPAGMVNPMQNQTSIDYIKGSRMRTDSKHEEAKRFGTGKRMVTDTTIIQCDKQRRISFNTKNKKYFVDPMSGQAGSPSGPSASDPKSVKKGGYVTISGGVTDTGERAKLFGYNAKHLKQTITITPSKDACQKEAMKIDIDGWYIDLPEWSCPVRRKPTEFQTSDVKCYDKVDFQMRGEITGVPVKEIKTLTMDGMTMNIEEEALEITKVPLSDAMFEPPAGYTAANTMKEVDEEEDGSVITAEERTIPEAATTTTATTLSVPKGGVEKTEVAVVKAPGMIRIGIAKPVVKLADKDTAEAADDLGDAAIGLLIESLKAANIEAVPLSGDPDADAKKLDCDYVVYTNFAQKHGGGGLLGKIVTANMAAMTGKSPQTDTNPTEASAVMTRVMSGLTKGNDEFSWDYKVTRLDKTVVSGAKGKSKANFDTEDVLTPKIRDASKAILTQVKPK